MTIQIAAPFKHGASKKSLIAALTSDIETVNFYDPSVFAGSRGGFSQNDVKLGERFAVVMDPQTRCRFSTVTRRANGTWKVE